MKLAAKCLTILLLMAIITPIGYASEAANPPPPSTLKELADNYKQVFLGVVKNKTIGAAYTYYTFNVTEWIKGFTGNHTLIWATYGGSEISHTPSASLYSNTEFLVFFDTHNSTHILSTPKFKLRGRYTDSELDWIRFDLAMGDYPSVESILAPLNESPPVDNSTISECPSPVLDLNSTYAQSSIEAVRKIIAAVKAVSTGAQPVSEFCITLGPVSGLDVLEDFAPYFLSLCLLSLVLLDRITYR